MVKRIERYLLEANACYPFEIGEALIKFPEPESNVTISKCIPFIKVEFGKT